MSNENDGPKGPGWRYWKDEAPPKGGNYQAYAPASDEPDHVEWLNWCPVNGWSLWERTYPHMVTHWKPLPGHE